MGCDADEKGLGRGPRLLKRDGLLEHGQKTHDEMLSDGLACAMCAAAVGGSYQRFLALWVLQMCSARAGNV